MKRAKQLFYVCLIVLAVGVTAIAYIAIRGIDYAYIPPDDQILMQRDGRVGDIRRLAEGSQVHGYDVWGEWISRQEAEQLMQTDAGRHKLAAENGAIAIDDDFLELGRKAFYEETFGNEVYLTDILGILDGALTLPNIAKAIAALNGEATNNLRVELAETITIGEKTYHKGEKVDTGLDVPQGAMVPLGMPVSYADGRMRVGISCAACHATVDRETGMVIEGAPNANLNTGLMMALAPNSTSFFTNTEIESLEEYITDESRTVENTAGDQEPLPDPEKLETAVDEILVNWPPGNFDSTIDLVANPTQIPDSFTLDDHPYGWTGFAAAGPFNGLSVLNNNVHAQNSDLLAQADHSQELFEIDKEVFMGTILQNAANPQYRYDYTSGKKPSEFFASVDPTPEGPGVNENITPPSYPKVTYITPNGSIIGSPGFKVAEQINAMSAYQHTLRPPPPTANLDSETVELGREVFERAGCMSCHSGAGYSNHRIIPADEVGSDPSRAKAFKDTEIIFDDPVIYSPDTPVPVPDDARVLQVPLDDLDKDQLDLAYAHGGTEGGYKVKGLVGLYWTAPYLHDGGVAVGSDSQTQVGIPGTLLNEIRPDPANSLRALLDQSLRQEVIAANRKTPALGRVNVQGIGHEHWVDQSTGFTPHEQDALIQYLLSL